MLEIATLLIGLVGFGLGAYWDLKYTEFPDWLPYSIITAALLVRTGYSYLVSDWSYLFNSLLVGGGFLAFGLGLYFAKQWGDGDAWLLGGLGFLLPDASGFAVQTAMPFPFALLFNFLIVSLGFLIAYSLAIGLRNEKVKRNFIKALKENGKRLSLLFVLFFAVSWSSAFYLYLLRPEIVPWSLILLPFLMVSMVIFTYFARGIENMLFRKKIPVSRLREGDVIMKGAWKGVTGKDIERIVKSGKKEVWIKEGVRFSPVFLIAFVLTLLFGGILSILV